MTTEGSDILERDFQMLKDAAAEGSCVLYQKALRHPISELKGNLYFLNIRIF